jgi:4-carboxymuconolactone decarboxylase
MDQKIRHEKGLALFRKLYGEDGERALRMLDEFAPDLSRYITEFAFGDVFSRPGLDTKTRELVTIGALAALGNSPAQLRSHIGGALNAGCSQQEIIEVFLHILLYAGFPAAMNGMAAAREVFTTRAATK